MILADDLIRHAARLLGIPGEPQTEVDLRRAVSASYYSVFHLLSEAAVRQIAPHLSAKVANRVHRWMDHHELKKICREFASPNLRPPLRDLLEGAASRDMLLVAMNFPLLQEARHNADYDLDFRLTREEAQEFVQLAVAARASWNRIAQTAEANIFILSLFLWKNWERER